jgi:hypothetical protein
MLAEIKHQGGHSVVIRRTARDGLSTGNRHAGYTAVVVRAGIYLLSIWPIKVDYDGTQWAKHLHIPSYSPGDIHFSTDYII